MPPKKKGGGTTGKKKTGKKSGSASSSNIIDGVSIKDMTREQLEGHVTRLRKELEREREERSYFQLERDQLVTFWELTRQQLEESTSQLKNKERDLEESEDKHEMELKVYKQRVKNLLLEHKNNEASLRTVAVESLQDEQETHLNREAELNTQIQELKLKLREQEISHQEQIKELKLMHAKVQNTSREEFEKQVEQIEEKWKQRIKELKSDLELQRSTATHEIEERKNAEINSILQEHEKSFVQIKNYYNDIILNNLALINSDKEKLEEYKRKEEKMEKEMKEVQAESKRLAKPLQSAKHELQELHRQLANYEKDRASLKSVKAQHKTAEEQLKKLSWDKEILQQRFNKVEKERDQIQEKFFDAISQVQQKSSMKTFLLEKQLQSVTDNLEKREVELSEVLSAAKLEPNAVAEVSQKLDDLLSYKNQDIRNLQLNLARMVKAYNDLLKQYESSMSTLGLSVKDVHFKPVNIQLKGGNKKPS